MSKPDLKTKTRLAMGELLDRVLGSVTPRHPATPSRALDLSELEERILLSASPMMAVAEMAEPATAEAMAEESAITTTEAVPSANSETSTSQQSNTNVSTNPSENVSHEIVFLDTSVEDYQQLLDDLWSNDDPNREIEVVLLSSLRDGIDQISEALAGREDLDAVHIVSHGTDAAVKLGSTWLTQDNLAGYVGEIARWGNSLSADADLLFYGCDLAASSDGQDLIDSLATLTGADVAASDDDTGHAIFGADWELEYQVGQIESDIAFSQSVQDNWGHIMNVTVDATSTGTTTGTSITISHTTTSAADRLMLVSISFGRAEGDSVGSVTYNGSALTFVGTQEDPDGRARIEIWSLVAPDAGTHDVVVTFSGGSGDEGATAGVTTFAGVDQATPLGAFDSDGNDSGTSGSVSVSSASGELVYGAVAVRGSDYDVTPGAGQSELFDAFVDSANGGASTEAGAASVATSYSWGTSSRWAIGGVSIRPSAATTTTITVNTANDVLDGDADTSSLAALIATPGSDGLISLREAITAANNQSGADTIEFSISGAGPHSINLASSLPDITDTIIINGASEPNYVAGTPVVELNGGGTVSDGLLLDTGSDGSTIRGLIINRFTDDGIQIDSDNNIIVGNWIGLDNTGLLDQGVGDEGLEIRSAGNVVGGTSLADRNVISGNTARGIYLTGAGATGNIIQGNFVGTNIAGTAAVGNTGQGIYIQSGASDNTVGGTTAFAGNLVSGNLGDGVRIDGAGSDRNVIQGNIIGLDVNGSAALGNGDDGIQIHNFASNNIVGGTTEAARNVVAGNLDDGVQLSGNASGNIVQGNYIGIDAAGTTAIGNASDGVLLESGASQNTIGGTATGSGNVISGDAQDGVRITGAGTSSNLVQGNYIGTNAAGTAALGNTRDGVKIEAGATDNTVGGDSAAARNVISGNRHGVHLTGSGTGDNLVRGNYIGTDVSGTGNLGNLESGVYISQSAAGNAIGGTEDGEGNLIAFSSDIGVRLTSTAGSGNSILRNSIHSNTGLGIDLEPGGATANDSGDADIGPNSLQNYPVLTSAFTDGSSSVAVTGTLNSTALTTFRLEFFSNSGGGDEGETYLGYRNVITNSSGDASFVESFAANVSVGINITATATNLATGDTSEFSVVQTSSSALIVDTTADTVDGTTTSVANLLANKGADGKISLREAVIATNNTIGHDGVFLSAGTYALSIAGTGESFAAQGDLNILESLSLIGAGAGSTIIDGSDLDRIFQTYSSNDYFFHGLTIQNATSAAASSGGALAADGTVTIADSVFRDNATPGGGAFGGAISSVGTLTLDAVRLTNNTSGDVGGALYNTGSTFIVNSLIDDNTATGSGGGIRNDGTLQIVNSTLDGNVATGLAGGISNNSGSAELVNVTISDSDGYGIASNTTTSMTNVIVAYSTMDDIIGTGITSGDGNLISDGTGSGFGAGDQSGVDPLLAPLTDNGGQTLTRALYSSSPAIDGGNPAFTSLAIDQRGSTRTGTADVGAFEGSLASNIIYVNTISDVADGTTTSFAALLADKGADGKISLREAIAAANNTTNLGASTPDEIRFEIADALVSGAHTIDMTAALPAITDSVIINGLTDRDATTTPVIELSGASAGATDGLQLLGAGSDGSTIIGLAINRFSLSGIAINGSDNNTIQRNYLGTDVAGTLDRGNTSHGVAIYNASTGNLIGGDTSTQGNVISANDVNGVDIAGTGTDNNTVAGNIIGLTADGTTDLGNTLVGVAVALDADANTIGLVGAGNVISGNNQYGIRIVDAGTNNNVIQSNIIGMDSTGTVALGNTSDGIRLESGGAQTGTIVGGIGAGEGNTISGNGGDGINVFNNTVTGVTILGNSIYSNTGEGIDLAGDGVTINDSGDADTGPNNLQNTPVLTSAWTNGSSSVTINGSINATANTTYRIEFFASTMADGTGYGEAERYLGATTVTTDGSGNVAFSKTVSANVAVGEFVTATATVDLGGGNFGETSEFAQNVTASPNAAPVLSGANNLTTINEDDVTNSGTLVTALISGQITDADLGSVEGIAVVAADNTDGSWEYTTDGGSNWTAFGAVSSSSARLLAADSSTAVRFVPDNDWNGTVTGGLTFHAWDQTSGNVGDTADVTPTSATLLDQFTTVSYSNNDGTATWTSNWTESDDDAVAVTGNIRVESNKLYLDNQDGSGFESITRSFDLTAASAANLTFDFGGYVFSGTDNFAIDISNDGGSNWGLLEEVSYVSSPGENISGNRDFDLTSFVSLTSDMAVRFRISAGFAGSGQHVTFDNIQIASTVENTGGTTAFSTATDAAAITVTAVNDDPINAGSLPTDVTVTEDVSTFINLSAIDLSDVDHNNQLVTVTLRTSTGGKLFAGNDSDVVVFGSGTGVLTLQGGVNDINTFLNSATQVSYLHGTQHTNGDNADTIQVEANDAGNTGTGGGGTVVLGTVNVDITAVNDNPVLTIPAGTTAYSEGSPQVIAPSVTLTDPDGLDFDGGQLTVSITSGGEATDDVYIFTTSNVLASGANLSYDFGSGFVLIGTISGGNGVGDPLIVTFNSNSTVDAIHDVVEQVFFRTLTDTPSTTSRVIEFDLTDGDGGSSVTQSRTVSVAAVNDAPTISAIGNQTIAEDGTTGALAFSVSDPETASGSLTVTATSGNTTLIPNGNLTLVDLGSGNWTIEAAPALNQNGGPVTVTVTVDDGTTTTDETFDVTVTAVNDAPTISLSGSPLNYTEGDGATIIDAGATATDVDSTDLGSGTLTVDFTANGTANDRLAINSEGVGLGQVFVSATQVFYNFLGSPLYIGDYVGGIDGSTPLVIIFNGNSTPTAVQAVMRNITFDNVSGNPTESPRTVRFVLTDGDAGSSSAVTQTINASAINSAPAISAVGDPTITEDNTTGALAFSVSDVETAAASLTVTAASSNTTIIPNSNLTLVDLGSGNWTIEAAPALNQNGGPVTITVAVDDGTTTTDETFTVTVTADNDAPTITALGDQTIAEDGTTGALAFSVSDVETAAASLTVTAASSNTTIIPNGNLTLVDLGSGNWTIEAAPALNQNGGPVTITVTVDDGTTTTDETFTVTVTADNDAPTITALGDQTIAEDGTTGALAFSVSDVETAAASLTVTAASSNTTIIPNGNLTLVDLGSGNWTIEAAPALNQNGGPVTITVTVDDGTTTTDETFTVTVTADNDAPTATIVPVGFGLAEDDPSRVIGGASVSDIDAGSNNISATLSVSDGDLTLITTTGLNFTAGANGTSTLTFEGTVSEINNALSTLEYQPDPDFNGSDTLTLFVDDLGNSGGGSKTSMDTATITVTAVNDVPLLDLDADDSSLATGNDFNQGFEEGGGPVSLIDSDVTLSDIDSANLSSITVVLTNRLDPASKEELSADATGTPLAANWDSGTDTLTIDGPGTVADYLTVLSTVAYDNTAKNPDVTTRTITFFANDGTDDSLVATTTLSFSAVNDAPVITSDGSGETASVNVTENAVEVTTVASSDVDGGTPVYSISGGADSTKFSIDDGTGILKFVTAPDFESPTDTDGDNDHEVIVQVSDQNGGFDTQTITVTVTAENDNNPIINSDGGGATTTVSVDENLTAVTTVSATDADLPGQTLSYAITGGADAAKFSINSSTGDLTFASAPNFETPTDSGTDNTYEVTVNASDGAGRTDSQDISVSVTDLNDTTPVVDGGQSLSVIESAGNGTSLGTVTATDPDTVGTLQNWTIVSGNTDSAFAINDSTGEITVVDAAGLDFETTPTYTLSIRVSDGTNTSANESVTINVTNANDAPTVVAPASDSVNSGESLTFSSSNGNAITVSDIEETELRIQLSVSNGVLTLANDAGLTFSVGSSFEEPTMTFEGSIANINSALEGLEFTHGDNHSGAATITVEATDFSATGPGGPLTDSQTINVTVLTPAGPPISGDAFLQGNFLEVGFGEDGILGSQGNAPVGFHSAGAILGVEVDHDRDGFDTGQVDGDFILPGTPEESFGVSVGGTTTFNSNSTAQAITGSLSNFQDTGTTQSLDFNGTASGLLIDSTHSVGINDQFMDVTVTLTNSTGGVVSDVYYFRNVDPDNNFDTSGTFPTTNTIVSQGNDGSAQAYVTATQADGSLLGLLGFGENARVTRGGFSNRDPIAIWNGTGGLNQAGTSTADEAVSLAFKYDSIGAGESVTFNYRYVFGETQAPVLDLDPDGSTGAATTNANVTYTENDGAVLIVDSDATIFDGDSTNLTGLTVQITNDLDGVDESLSANTTGTSIVAAAYNSSTGVLSLTGSDTVANYRQVLRTLTYTNNSETPDTTTRQIQITTTDGTYTSNTARAFVSVSAVNDVPIITSNGAADSASISVAENSTSVTTVTSSDLDSDTPTYSITGGADSARFNIDSGSGVLTFASAPNFENPTDAGTDNQYEVTVSVSDGNGGTDSQNISVSVTAVNDNAPQITSNGTGDTAAISVAENSTAVTTVTATDDDLPAQTLNYSISGGADAARFNIDESTGVLTFAAAPDFENATDAGTDNDYEVVVRVSDGISFSDPQTITVTVTDLDEFDITATTDVDGGTDSVNENVAAGVSVGIRASATDNDGTNNTVTYSLDDNSNGEFFIASAAGDIKVAGPIDREAGATRTITVRATSADGSFSTRDFTIAINDVDEFDVTAISDADATLDNVDENAMVGTEVGITAAASDADATNNGITYSLDDNAGGQFSIDSGTGQIVVASAIDREAGATRTITVRATSDDGSFSTRDFTIAINDLDEFDTTAIIDTDVTLDNVDENAAVGTSVGITAFASDADATTNTVTYSLDDDSTGQFAINDSTGEVTVAGAIDREARATRTITVRATSDDGSFSTKDFTIAINDLDEFDTMAITDNDVVLDNVDENASVGTSVGITAFASDADATTNTITYSLDDDSTGQFAINGSTGEVTVAGTIDREVGATRIITVRATSDDGSFSTKDFTIAINDLDEFDVAAISDSDVTLDNVDENATVGTSVGVTAFASDADATTNTITYSLDDDSTGQFAINGPTGEVTVAGAIDREAGATRTITVRATSADGSFSTEDFTIAINDLDEFDITAISDVDGGLDAVNENAGVGVSVGIRASASDADATTNTITYSLDDDSNGEFFIESAAGDVKVAGSIDREAGATRTITVRATSADGSFSTKDFTIAINDLNDNAPIINAGQSFDVSEFASNGDSLGTATATDADTVGTIQNWAITGGNVDSIFEIDAASGELRVSDNSLLNFETTATYILSLRVEDGANTSSIQTVTVNVGDENDVPVLDVNAGVAVVEGGDVIISSAELSVSDEDELAGEIRYTIGDAPTAGRLELTSDPGVSISSFTQADIDNNLLRFVHDGSEADDSFTFSISDGSGGTIGTTLFSITNLRVNDAPVNAVPISQTTAEDTPLIFSSAGGNSVSVSDVDLNGGMIGVRLLATSGTLTLGSTSGLVFATGDGNSNTDIVFAGLIADVNNALEGLTFSPTADYNGPATVRIITRDMGSSGSGGEQIDDDTIKISVTAVNDNPVAADDEYATSEDIPLTVTAAGGLLSNDSDIDGDALNVVAVAGPSNGALSLSTDGSFVYTPNTNFNGVDSFTYRATDGSLQSETRTVTLNVAAVNDAPVTVDDEITIDQLTVLELSAANGVLVNDLDVEADTLQAILVSGPQNGQLVLNADGSLTYTPTATFFGEDTFTYRSNDGSDDGSIATVRIIVRQTVTSGGDGSDGDGGTDDGSENGDDGSGTTDDGNGTTDGNDGDNSVGNDVSNDATDTDSNDGLTAPPAVNQNETTDETTGNSTNDDNETNTESNNGNENQQQDFAGSFRIDERGELRDRMTGRVVEDAGVVVFTSTDVGSMVYVLEQTGFWTELDTFEQDVQNSILEEGEWEELVVETTTVAGTTLTVGYIVWLLRSGSVVFGLVSSLPAWTMMDPLPVLQSGLEDLGDIDNSDDDSLQGILQAHSEGLESSAESFES